jgi:hypothetical protein
LSTHHSISDIPWHYEKHDRAMRTKFQLVLLLSTTVTIGSAQSLSRLIASSFRSAQGEPQLVLLDSVFYTYSEGRGGDLTTPDLLYDESFHWQRSNGTFTLIDGHARLYNALDQVAVDTSFAFPRTPGAFSFVRWTYDGQGRPSTEVWFSGVDSIFYRTRTYTPSGKPATVFVSQPYQGAWANTLTTFTYNAVDSLTDRVVVSDFLSYAFRWRYSPEGWLVRYEEDTPSDPLAVDYYYYPNGKLMAQRDSAGAQPWMMDSTFYTWNSTFDTVVVDGYNGQFGFEQPNSRTRLAYDASGRQVERIPYEFVGNTWVPQSRQASTYTPFGALSVDSFFTWTGSAFAHALNETYTYAPDERILERVVHMNDNGTLVPVSRGTWTYNTYGQLVRTTQDDTLAGSWHTVGDQRYYYEEYAAGVAEGMRPSELRVFPNPAEDRVRCLLPEGVPGTVTFALYDAGGKRQPLRTQGSGQERVLHFEDAAPGLYLLEVTAGTWRRTVRIVLR